MPNGKTHIFMKKTKKRTSKVHKSLDNAIKIVYNIFCMDTVGNCLFFVCGCEKATFARRKTSVYPLHLYIVRRTQVRSQKNER